MKNNITRRQFAAVSATAALVGSLASSATLAAEVDRKALKILGIACSPRKGMTTAAAVQAALDAAKGLDSRIEVELIDGRPRHRRTISPPFCRNSKTPRWRDW